MSDIYKSRVLIVNKFYYRRGGDCVYTLALEELLKRNGHAVANFSMAFSENIPSDYSSYFPVEVSFSGSVKSKLDAAKRVLGIGEVTKKFKSLLNDFQPDVVHLNNIHSYLSPVIAKIAKEFGCRVVWTLHDYKLICPSYSCLCRGEVCEECLSDSTALLKRRCMKDSLAASVLAYVEARYWSLKRVVSYTDMFICPSAFMKEMMIKGGVPKERLKVISNFITNTHNIEQTTNNHDYYCYVGRLSDEKGVRTLIKGASQLNRTLKIAGGGPLKEELEREFASDKVIFLGHLTGEQVGELLVNAKFSVMPSECYDNNPLGVIESLCYGTPVLGANIGGIPELIEQNSGMLYTSRDIESLKVSIEKMFENSSFNREDIAKRAKTQFASQTYYNRLLSNYML